MSQRLIHMVMSANIDCNGYDARRMKCESEKAMRMNEKNEYVTGTTMDDKWQCSYSEEEQ
jgi:hypothetical protein